MRNEQTRNSWRLKRDVELTVGLPAKGISLRTERMVHALAEVDALRPILTQSWNINQRHDQVMKLDAQ